MEFVKIYEDGEQEITMFKPVADWLSYQKLASYRLDMVELEEIFHKVLDIIPSIILSKDSGLVISRTIPVISKETIIKNLLKPYDIFEEALLLMSDAYGFLETKEFTRDWCDQLALLVESYYLLQGLGDCLCHFFPEPVFKVDGFLRYKESKDRIIVLPFIINDGKFQKIY